MSKNNKDKKIRISRGVNIMGGLSVIVLMNILLFLYIFFITIFVAIILYTIINYVYE